MDKPFIHTAHLTCRPDAVDAFRERLLRHARITLQRETGCLRFLIHQDRQEPTRFLLVEHYTDESALRHHHGTDHFLEFRADTRAWVVDRQWWFWEALD